jgi:hypothetical protein
VAEEEVAVRTRAGHHQPEEVGGEVAGVRSAAGQPEEEMTEVVAAGVPMPAGA